MSNIENHDEWRISELEKENTELASRSNLYNGFINMAAHEIKTPITVLKAYTQMLLMQFEKEKSVKHVVTVGKMSDQIDKIMNIIADMMDTDRLSSDSLHCLMNSFDIEMSITTCCENVKAAYPSYSISCETEGGGLMVNGDRERLEQVINNFINNAIKYSGEEKVIRIKSRTKEGQAIVSVQDNGIGIPASKQEYVFNQFYRVDDTAGRKTPGLGLGLFICAEIIRKHGGKIGVESQEGEGSIFWFSIPAK